MLFFLMKLFSFCMIFSVLAINVNGNTMEKIGVHVAVKNDHNRVFKNILLEVVVTNKSNVDIKHWMIEGRPSFTYRVWDDSETKLISRIRGVRKKDRSQKGVEQALDSGSSNTYEVEFDIESILTLVNGDISKVDYLKVAVVYPLVQYVNNKYGVKLIESNKIRFSVIRNYSGELIGFREIVQD